MNKLNEFGIPNDAVITVAGMVGAGKSTLTNALAKKLNFRTSMEKVDNNPYLEDFYHDFKRWSFHLQIFFLAERFKEQKRMFDYGGGFVQDRSIYEDTGIFARMHYDKGNMSEVDYETYTHLYEAMVMTPYFPQPDCLIYLEGSFDDIVSRIQQRGRKMEQETPISYWEEMFERYEKWIESFNACPILRVNINDYDLRKNPESIDTIVEKISQKIEAKRGVHL